MPLIGPRCNSPHCLGGHTHRAYARISIRGKRIFIPIGWYCTDCGSLFPLSLHEITPFREDKVKVSQEGV